MPLPYMYKLGKDAVKTILSLHFEQRGAPQQNITPSNVPTLTPQT